MSPGTTSPGNSAPGDTARLLADLHECLAQAAPEQRGALWRLAESARQLDANLVRLPPDAVVPAHTENDLDVLLLVVAGSGTLRAGEGAGADELPLAATTLAWLPRTARRALHAGPQGLDYLTVHRRRPGLTIRGTRPDPADEGGDSACWLHRLCPACGMVPDGTAPAYCSHCGEHLPPE
ncbi:hypothetical protein GCM10009665_41110 [Kitasatospora nipponensis]|uniref:Cupin domain-containing protein n=1 Tax=Kitasatospora nipponensis TaxID=258049 RepID=A0ABP4H1B4_9ACTN